MESAKLVGYSTTSVESSTSSQTRAATTKEAKPASAHHEVFRVIAYCQWHQAGGMDASLVPLEL